MKKIVLPKFKNEDEERDFWDKFDISKYDIKASDFQGAYFPNLKPTSQSISIRIPKYMLVRLKEKANAINVPYQALIKSYIQKGLLG